MNDRDDSNWMTMESIGGYPWWAWTLSALMVLIPLAIALVSWLRYG